jgi:hypothetical protein
MFLRALEFVFAPLQGTEAARFWEMKAFELDCIGDQDINRLRDRTNQANDYFSNDEPKQ